MMEPIDIAYDVIAGVSIGAINAALFSIYKRGDEKEAIQNLLNLWQTKSVIDFWRPWETFSYLAMLWKPSLVDNTKMINAMIDEMVGRKFEKMINIISVDLNTGDIIIFDESTPVEKQPFVMVATSSIPGVFPPEETVI